jgi:hypothetical protein
MNEPRIAERRIVSVRVHVAEDQAALRQGSRRVPGCDAASVRDDEANVRRDDLVQRNA